MAEDEPFTLTVVDGLTIERAALLALLRQSLPQFRCEQEGSPPAATIGVVDLDAIPLDAVQGALAELSSRYGGLVVLSATDSLETVRAVLRLPRAAFVWKGDDPGELTAAVVSVASGRTWISDAARQRFLRAGEDRRPVLSPQESRVMRSYGSGAAVKDVALDMRIAEHTVRTYIKRIRAKYLDTGVALESRVDFYRHLGTHDVAFRNGGDRVRPRLQQAGGDTEGGTAA